MEEELLPAPVTNPKSVNHYVSMKHQFDTAKLRDLLREVKLNFNFVSFHNLNLIDI